MTRLTVDQSTKEQLTASGQLIEVCDQSGQTIGYFHPVRARGGGDPITDELRQWANKQFSNEEIDRALEDPSGCTTEELIAKLRTL